MTFYEHVLAVETEIRLLGDPTGNEPDSMFHPARRVLASAFSACIAGARPKGQSLPDLVDALTREATQVREPAILLLRSLGRPGLVPATDQSNQMDRKAVELVLKALPDIAKQFKIDPKAQTFSNAAILRTVHGEVCRRLEALRAMPVTPDALARTRQDVMKLLGGQLAQGYLHPFDIKRITNQINGLYAELETLLRTTDHSFSQKLQALKVVVEEQQGWINTNRTFLTDDFFGPFLSSIANALVQIDRGSSARFDCEIRSASGGDSFRLEKRYPLRDPKRLPKIAIPLSNGGPGVAANVRASITCPDGLVSVSDANLGDIPPGEFALVVELLPDSAKTEVTVEIEISWALVSTPERHMRRFQVRVLGQSVEVDWGKLEKREPYSTSPAEGDEFVGRKEKVLALSNRLLRDRLQSSYITGQKRVGKSSLALAVRNNAQALSQDGNVQFVYLEYGELADVEPKTIMRNLGLRIADFLSPHLPPGVVVDQREFIGSLAPLSRLADAIAAAHSDKRFIVILDEFDEIPSELYRSGALAETFFSNLRTLSAKKNLAFMLVGGENMPFIVAAQGDQLNKFVREPLTYFSRADEWADFKELVTAPVRGALQWHESAVSEVYTMTSGHPYYAKLLCARVYATAVSERDTEITAEEVRRAYRALVSSLDINSFAHLWKDGIKGTREEAENISLQRCRVLVSLGRVLRAGKLLTEQSVRDHKYTALLHDHQIAPILADFCRRGILREDRGEHSFTLLFFRDWIAQSGVNMLIDDTLGDELSVGLQKAEDAAYVRDAEITSLTDTWPLYRSTATGPTDVRHWLGQVTSFRQQRLLLKILQNLRFFSEQEIREKLQLAHQMASKSLPEFVRRSMADRRRDVLVTYLDGAAKSGAYYAARYAEENLLSSDTVKSLSGFAEELVRHEEKIGSTVNGLIVVDDIVGTGRTLATNLQAFVDMHRELISVRNMSVIVVVMCSALEGEAHLRDTITSLSPLRIDLRVCEPLAARHFAFRDSSSIWSNADEAAEARALCRELGERIVKKAPLGYNDQGLLVVFPNTCPNNTLPILHGASSRDGGWRPLFKRPVN